MKTRTILLLAGASGSCAIACAHGLAVLAFALFDDPGSDRQPIGTPALFAPGQIGPGAATLDPYAGAAALQAFGYGARGAWGSSGDNGWSSSLGAGNYSDDLSQGYVALPGGEFATHGF